MFRLGQTLRWDRYRSVNTRTLTVFKCGSVFINSVRICSVIIVKVLGDTYGHTHTDTHTHASRGRSLHANIQTDSYIPFSTTAAIIACVITAVNEISVNLGFTQDVLICF